MKNAVRLLLDWMRDKLRQLLKELSLSLNMLAGRLLSERTDVRSYFFVKSLLLVDVLLLGRAAHHFTWRVLLRELF